MSNGLTDDDREQLRAIMDARNPAIVVTKIYDYYHDRDRADRTPRQQLYLHLGMVCGHVMTLLEARS